jgi:hypothetical protein
MRHDIRLYPAIGSFHGDVALGSQQELLDWLKEVLSSEKTKRVVSALLTQSR